MSKVSNIICTPCLREDKVEDAVKYCVECNDNLCRVCLRSHIKNLASINQHHRLLNRDEMPQWLSGSATEVSNMCTRHKDNQLDTYCKDHDVVCCGACLVIEHSSCENVKDLVSLSSESEPKSETDLLLKDLKFMMDALKDLRDSRRRDQSKLRKSTAHCLSLVRNFREQINDIFDRLEKQAIEDIDTECIVEDNVVEADITRSENSITLIEIALKKIRDIDREPNVPITETNLKVINGKKLLKDIKQLYQEVQEKTTHFVNFHVNEKIVKYISALKNIGTCKTKGNRKSEMSGKLSKYIVDMGGDTVTGDFQDVQQTESGTFLLLDAENKCILQLNKSFEVTKLYNLIEKPFPEAATHCMYEPFAICCVADHTIAVSMTRDKVVKQYKLSDQLVEVSETDIGEYCRGLAFNRENEQLYVACGGGSYIGEGLGHIRVYSLKGELLRSFKQTQDRKIISPRPMHLAVDNDCSKILIADAIKGIIAVDTTGRLLSVFTAPELSDSRGICVDVNDHVIVCGYSSNVVLRIQSDMKEHDVLLTEENGIRNPQSLCYDTALSKCVFTIKDSNEISAFDV